MSFTSSSQIHYLNAFVIQCLGEESCICPALFFNTVAIYEPFLPIYLGRLSAMGIPRILQQSFFSCLSIYLSLSPPLSCIRKKAYIVFPLYSFYFVSFNSTLSFLPPVFPEILVLHFSFSYNLILPFALSCLCLLIKILLITVCATYVHKGLLFHKGRMLAFCFLKCFSCSKSCLFAFPLSL